MKKIVSILAVAAVLASSVFAADVSAKAKIDGSLANYDGSNFSALSIKHGSENWNPNLAFATSGDVAGASFKFYDTGDGADFTPNATGYSIWLKPVDALKITVGNWSTNLNQEHIGWCNTDSSIDSYGYALSIAAGAVSADVFLAPGWATPWFAGNAVAETFAKVQFGADFGTINAEIDAKDNFGNIMMGAGVNVAGLPVGLWVNILAYMNNGFQKIRAELDVSGSAGSLGYEVFVAAGYNTNGGYDWSWWHVGKSANQGAFAGIYAKASFPVATCGAFVEVKVVDALASPFAINIKPGVTGSVGACGWEIDVDANINGSAVTVDVPVHFTVNF